MAKRLKTILLFGAPGAGKGTQGKILGRIPGFFHLSSGDMFRALDPNSDLGQRVTSYSSKGELVPDDLTITGFDGVPEASVSINTLAMMTTPCV